MKKSPYISKYDFINYYARPQGLWFFTNSEIEAAIKLETQKLKIKDYDQEDENNEESFDSFDKYREILEENDNVDLNNPLIIEGNIIDKNSRQYLMEQFDNDYKVIDLDQDYAALNSEQKANLTLKLIAKHNKLILFQAVFISKINDIDVITKPDGIVIDNKEIKIYETKGTSSAKKHHLLDLYFQAKVIESIKELKNYNFNYFLILVAFELANKNECPLIATEYCNIGKSVTFDLKKWALEFDYEKAIEYGQDIKMGNFTNKTCNYDFYPFSIKQFINKDFSMLQERMEKAKPSRKSIEAFIEDALKMYQNFEKIILDLFNHKNLLNDHSMPIIEKPGYGDKSEWKNDANFISTRKIYAEKGCELLNFSGNVMDQSFQAMQKFKKGADLKDYYRFEKNAPLFNKLFFEDQDVTIPVGYVSKFMNNIKANKVYFDFETINTAIRVFDQTLPFRQIITQSSVIVASQGNTDFKCDNLLIDPLKIDQAWFKAIVDSLYYGNDYSYIVYNASFERSRLNEIKDYLNDEIYANKIDVINSNLVDLAELFDFRKDHGIIFKQLYGFYSIKKVLPLIEKLDQKIFKEVKCLDYKTLNVANGSQCQGKTAERFFNLLNDKQWQAIAKDLKIYCENDVRAMVAIEHFVVKLLNQEYPDLKVRYE